MQLRHQILRCQHHQNRAALFRIIHAVHRPGFGMMKIAGAKDFIADMQITGNHVNILWTTVPMSRIARARLKLSKNNSHRARLVHGQQFDQRTRDRKPLPLPSRNVTEESQSRA